ncbi:MULTISPECIES: type II toxin-antitoxin system mRNA interferase toxin, RelE/StbE family [unclassified Microcystis]|uniref:type II toxin-antitoxin system RelE/ParE family toxin n=1 Tax=unclassified Microcystis TaxID=2643300 RepID=UPI0011929FCD|nr:MULTISPECIES: type II toxin-antitoxin system mRNA interferase toxin, RelE/StbE family [unclassified Microcystis]MCA2925282.1 type II toxin-antitoxin system mRNA interferase toxin, RelE/StbE family [Microcystis sp. M020S1]MCA2934511.1 type II toxin-antitoxin system mRNA interferase toxin, RelE/StbE family [Microcystis sp. M015S1]MCA2619909.1 type II toxin-antitoxin system mRNA interferase toxin, RelE/StbE family [Microcystis sp. M099S2]MCA2652593.1 type II toxin-antitoxin system mRNA interfer
MIESFQHKGLKQFYERGERRGLNPNMIPKIEEILSIFSAAESVEEANIPGYRLHPLTGELKGFWSVRVTGNWRIVFRFEDGNALDIDLVDYH